MTRLINGLAILVFGFAALGQLNRLEPIPGVSFYLFEPMLALLVVLLVWTLRSRPFQLLRLRQFTIAVMILMSWLAVTFLISTVGFSGLDNGVALLYLLRLTILLVGLVYWLCWCMEGRVSARLLSSLLLFTIGVTVGSALLQYLYYPNLRNLSYLGWDPHQYRVFGLYFEPVLIATISGILLYAIAYSKVLQNIPARVMVAASLVVVLLASFSRAAYLALFVSCVPLLRKVRVGPFILAGVGIVVILVLLPKPGGEGVNLLRTSTISSRSTDYRQGWQQVVNNPAFGIGYNHIGAVKVVEDNQLSEQNHAAASFHSSYLIVAATTGVIGLVLFLNMLVHLSNVSVLLRRILLFVGVVALLDNVLLHVFVLLALMLVGGYAVIRPSYK